MRKRLLKAIAKRIFISEGAIGSSAFNSRCNGGSLKEIYDEGFPSANLTDEEIDKISEYISETEGRVSKFLRDPYQKIVADAMQEKEEG